MNKKILLFGFSLIFAIGSYAQKFSFGVQGGFVIANSHIMHKPKTQGEDRRYYPLYTYSANLYLGYKGKGNFGISMEPGYLRKGGHNRYYEYLDPGIKEVLDYAQLPILLDYYISNKFFVSIGPELAYLLKASHDSRDQTYKYDNPFEISGLVAINYNIFSKLDVAIRYSHAFTYSKECMYYDLVGKAIYHDLKVYNQYFQVLVRFKI